MESLLKCMAAVAEGGISMLYGQWNSLLQVLTVIVVIDSIAGIVISKVRGELHNRAGMIGIARTIFMFLLIAIAHHMDIVLGQTHYFQDAVTYFYIANGLISILENGIKLGVPVPGAFRRAILKFKELSEEDERSAKE
ncbi:phage holin family protein [Paenibacillus profundus]|uniref:Phage holin family protein n=1 Tax=Paenibacillus profundus TaxID=1173085 RepID=A0ABS8YK41_9BACL|nr:phage holin family protein [Paenibacillus profundus]MCE5170691.1 phage holin family protein [Paenibacillus profundus]